MILYRYYSSYFVYSIASSSYVIYQIMIVQIYYVLIDEHVQIYNTVFFCFESNKITTTKIDMYSVCFLMRFKHSNSKNDYNFLLVLLK
jgi:hypothetical protein